MSKISSKLLQVFVAAVFYFGISSVASAQVETALTIGAVRSLLADTIEQLQGAIETAGSEIKGVGNSLQANAQNVIKDIDTMFKDNLELTFDRMDESQRNIYRDAQALTRQMQQAATAIVTVGGAEARRAIADADIAAYNASYSLPCRSQIPRFVYSTPEAIRAGQERAVVTIKGNFLDVGADPEFNVGSTKATIIARGANEIRVQLPTEQMTAGGAAQEVALSARLKYRKKSLLLWMYCYDREAAAENATTVAVTLLPPRIVAVSGWVLPTVGGREERSVPHNVDLGRPGACDANIDVSRQVCSPDDWKVKSVEGFHIVSANCGSNGGPPQISGDRCVNVPGRITGCGYDRVLGQRVNCRGRGWLHWAMTVNEYRDIRIEKEMYEFAAGGSEKFSFTFKYPENAQILNSPKWTYGAKITVSEGPKSAEYEVSNANENAGIVGSRLVDGVLSITLTP